MTKAPLDQHRLVLAGTREFTLPGAGLARRQRLATYSRRYLAQAWRDAVDETPAGARHGVALAAVGSLARGDAGPLSDFDLVLLHDGRSMSGEQIDRLADRLWYPLWDDGVRLDHSVRTLAECRQVAQRELSATVGMLDLVHLAGDEVIVAGVRQAIGHDWRANARRRLPELIESVRGRHERHGDLSSSLEPDLKEGRGGLRDMRVLQALTATWLADRPRGGVDAAYEQLLDVRDALHVVTGRGRTHLVRQDQDAVAAILGLHDADDLLARVGQSARLISNALDHTLRRSGQAQRARVLRVGPRRPQLSPLGYGLFVSDGEIVLGPRAVIGDTTLLLLRAARVAATRSLPISPTTLANLARGAQDLPDPWPSEIRDAFIDLLASGPGLAAVWEELDLAGVIGRWLPEWHAVRARPQRNPVHRFTVDRHLVQTAVEAAGHRADVQRPDLLLVAALLHDIGKIPGVQDHATEGAPVAANIARRMGFDADDVGLVELLVERHLGLVDLATRRDPREPQTVAALVALVEERPDVLDLLRALTEADARAAGPKAWTAWRAGLVDELTGRAAATLQGRRPTPSEPAVGVEPADEVIGPPVTGRPHIDVRPTPAGARITISDRDRLGLFADSAGLLAAAGLIVRAARLTTREGVATNLWQVETPHGDLPDVEALQRNLVALAEGDRSVLRPLRRRATAEPRRAARTRAIVIPDGSKDATVIEVRSADRPGLLRDIGMTFAEFGLSVRSAHVATYAGQSLDTFYVTSATGAPVEPPAVARLIGALIDACDGGSDTGR